MGLVAASMRAVGAAQLSLVVKYEPVDVSNTAQSFQDNTAVMKALVGKFPELLRPSAELWLVPPLPAARITEPSY